MKKILTIILICIISTAYLIAQNYKVQSYVIGSSGQSVQNNSNKVKNTLGEPAIGPYENQNNKVFAGFWYSTQQNTGMRSPLLVLPQNNSQNIDLSVTLEWQFVQDASSYILQVSFNSEFNNLLINTETVITSYKYLI